MPPDLLVDQLREELRPDPLAGPLEVAGGLLVLLLRDDVRQHVRPVSVQYADVLLVLIVVALLDYEVRRVLVPLAPGRIGFS